MKYAWLGQTMSSALVPSWYLPLICISLTSLSSCNILKSSIPKTKIGCSGYTHDNTSHRIHGALYPIWTTRTWGRNVSRPRSGVCRDDQNTFSANISELQAQADTVRFSHCGVDSATGSVREFPHYSSQNHFHFSSPVVSGTPQVHRTRSNYGLPVSVIWLLKISAPSDQTTAPISLRCDGYGDPLLSSQCGAHCYDLLSHAGGIHRTSWTWDQADLHSRPGN